MMMVMMIMLMIMIMDDDQLCSRSRSGRREYREQGDQAFIGRGVSNIMLYSYEAVAAPCYSDDYDIYAVLIIPGDDALFVGYISIVLLLQFYSLITTTYGIVIPGVDQTSWNPFSFQPHRRPLHASSSVMI